MVICIRRKFMLHDAVEKTTDTSGFEDCCVFTQVRSLLP
jgi:hypothetical protein